MVFFLIAFLHLSHYRVLQLGYHKKFTTKSWNRCVINNMFLLRQDSLRLITLLAGVLNFPPRRNEMIL